MSQDPLGPYQQGDQLRHQTVNAVNAFVRQQMNSGGAPEIKGLRSSQTVVLMQNSSGEDVDRFGVLGIDGVAITRADSENEFFKQILLDGATPSGDASSDTGHAGKFAIALRPIAANSIGPVVVSGVVQVQINVIDEDHKFADVSDGDNTQLESTENGAARILYKEDGTGTVWAVVNIGGAGAASGDCISIPTSFTISCDNGAFTVTPGDFVDVLTCPDSGSSS